MTNPTHTQAIEKNKTSSTWFRAVRPFSFTASVIPVLFGAALAGTNGEYWLLPLVLIAAVILHAGANLISDAYDFKLGVDRPGSPGSSGVLTEGLLSFSQVHRAGLLAFGISAAIGAGLATYRGWPVLALGLIGLLGGYLYCGGPRGYKYAGLGDLMIGIFMGPMMVFGSYGVLTGDFTTFGRIAFESIPIAFLVTAILHANNMRDSEADLSSHVKTVANQLGLKNSQRYFAALIIGAYAFVVGMVAAQILPPIALITLLSFKLSVPLLQAAWAAGPAHRESLIALDVRTAQLHLMFGALLCVALAVNVAMHLGG